MTLLYDYDTLVDIELGKIVRLPLFQITGTEKVNPILLKKLALQIKNNKRNYLPVIVKLLAEDNYEAIYNIRILEAARYANYDFIWCIVADEFILHQIKIELGEVIPIDILTASEQNISDTLEYIKEKESRMSSMNSAKAARAIVKYRENKTIKNLNFLTLQKCGIGRSTLSKIKPYLLFV